MKESRDLPRSVLVGMIARLRGTLVSVQFLMEDRKIVPSSEDFLDRNEIARVMKDTTFNLSSEDEVDGGFDKSWETHPSTDDEFGGIP